MDGFDRLLLNSTLTATASAALHQIDTDTLGKTLLTPEADLLSEEHLRSFNQMKMILFFAIEYQKAFPKP